MKRKGCGRVEKEEVWEEGGEGEMEEGMLGEKGRGSDRGCGGEGVRGRRRRRVWSKKWEDGRSEGVRE